MCGIVGILSKTETIDFRQDLRKMSELIHHRGPDDEGFYTNLQAGVFLGHRRLSIIDLSERGRQPLFNETGDICVIFNGEIYNFKVLRDQLSKKGHVFASDTDTEVILHSYEEWGEACVQHFRGMFAYAIWDAKMGKLVLVRDRVGIKPLYYLDTPELFAFASEAKAFFGLSKRHWTPRIREESLRDLIVCAFIPSNEHTLLQRVKKLAPGHMLVWQGGQIRTRSYWELHKNNDLSKLSFEEAVEVCETKLSETVRLMLNADVPVGILLSGGLDSSLIAALAQKNSTKRVHTFTVGYDHPLDERRYAQVVANHIGSIHTPIEIDLRNVYDRLEEIIPYFDDLSSVDGGIISTFLISEQVKQRGVKVLLVGEGGDEVFGGYSWYGLSQMPWCFLPRAMRSWLHHYAFSRVLFSPDSIKNTLNMDKIVASFREDDIFRQICKFEIAYQLPNHYLMKVDKGTMAHSLEARVPYLDEEVIEFAYSLPRTYKLDGHWFNMRKINEKFILRCVARGLLPIEITRRKKRGFSLPQAHMLKDNMDKVRDSLTSSGSIALTLFSRKELERLFDFKSRNYQPIEIQKEVLLWRLFIIQIWSQAYLR